MGDNPGFGSGVGALVNSFGRCHHQGVPRAIVVDDHRAFRASARRLLEVAGYDVVGEAEDGASGLALARELEPELVLLDVALPDMSGFDVADELADGASAVVLVSSRDPADVGRRAAKSSALGFIAKDRLSEESLRELVGDTP
jgi:DNA-binding NarL/FixJ family response regulator